MDKAEPFHRALTVPVFPQHLPPVHNTDTEDGFWKDFGGLQKSGAGRSHSYRTVWRERLWKYTFFQTDDLIIQIHFYLQIVPDFVTETALSLHITRLYNNFFNTFLYFEKIYVKIRCSIYTC